MSTHGPGGREDTTSSHALPGTTGEQPQVGAEDASGLSTDEQAAVHDLPEGSALLVVQRGPNQGARYLLDAARTTAGRNPQSDIFLDDVTVSRRHAEFVREPSEASVRFLVRDAGSLNGTYVNRDRVDEVELAAGDEVQVGKYRLVFQPAPSDVRGEAAGGPQAAEEQGRRA